MTRISGRGVHTEENQNQIVGSIRGTTVFTGTDSSFSFASGITVTDKNGSTLAGDRDEIGRTARGFVSETFHSALATTSNIPTVNAASGTLVLGLVPLKAGDSVTKLWINVATAGTALSFAKLALYNSTGGFIFATSSLSAQANTSTGIYGISANSIYAVTADGGYYVGYLQYGSGATGATLQGTRTYATGGYSGVGTGVGAAALVTGQTDLTATVALAAATTGFWFGVS